MSLVKYPRTPHLPWSEGMTSDDKMVKTLDHFRGKQILVSEKFDGENTSIYRDHIHARSLDSRHHESRTWVKQFWNQIRSDIPENWRICGENVYARHSIGYTDLPSFFMGFSIWNESNVCLSWDETMEWFELFGITPVTTLYVGMFDEQVLRKLTQQLDTSKQEGYVVRVYESFHFSEFNKNVAKYVRKNHVQTTDHWMHCEITPNQLAC
jgi:ATP-dependent RNA circularization protein (DNA/RNA ligase family)